MSGGLPFDPRYPLVDGVVLSPAVVRGVTNDEEETMLTNDEEETMLMSGGGVPGAMNDVESFQKSDGEGSLQTVVSGGNHEIPVEEMAVNTMVHETGFGAEEDFSLLERLGRGDEVSKEELKKSKGTTKAMLAKFIENKGHRAPPVKGLKTILVDAAIGVMGDVKKAAEEAASMVAGEAAETAGERAANDRCAVAAVKVEAEEAPNAIKEAAVKKAAEDAEAIKASKDAEEAAVKAAEVAAGIKAAEVTATKAVEEAAANASIAAVAVKDAEEAASRGAEETATKATKEVTAIKKAA